MTTERSTWGGLRKESIPTSSSPPGSATSSCAPGSRGRRRRRRRVEGRAERLSRFRERIEDDRESMSKRFTSFKGNVGTEIGNRKWLSHAARCRSCWRCSRSPAPARCSSLGRERLALGLSALERRRAASASRVASFVNAAIMVGALTQRKLWRRRSRDGEVEAERWEAFRRYLTDFPRLQEAPPATLALWERFLVYGIAFGIADRVLQAAHLEMPEELAQASSIYWISPGGDLGAARPRWRSATSPPASARRSRHRPPARAAAAAGSPAVEAEAAAAEAAAAPGSQVSGRRSGARRRKFVERDRARGCDVERLRLAGHRDRGDRIARGEELVGQPIPLGPEHDRHRRGQLDVGSARHRACRARPGVPGARPRRGAVHGRSPRRSPATPSARAGRRSPRTGRRRRRRRPRSGSGCRHCPGRRAARARDTSTRRRREGPRGGRPRSPVAGAAASRRPRAGRARHSPPRRGARRARCLPRARHRRDPRPRRRRGPSRHAPSSVAARARA